MANQRQKKANKIKTLGEKKSIFLNLNYQRLTKSDLSNKDTKTTTTEHWTLADHKQWTEKDNNNKAHLDKTQVAEGAD